MDRATRDCLVVGYEKLVPSLRLPDPNDRHVLAAAIAGRCDFIVTQNLRDFPKSSLSQYGIEARHPDAFLCGHLALTPGLFCVAVRKVRARLRNPPYSVSEYLDNLARQGLEATAAELARFGELL